MKKSTIKYLAILVIIIIIISFTAYNIETEPHNIETVNRNYLNQCNNTFFIRYLNLTYGNSKAEYIITYSHLPGDFYAGYSVTFGTINIYKISQSLNFPLTGTAIEGKDIEVYVNNHPYSYNSKTYFFNNTISVSLWTIFSSGNLNISVSFNIIPVYNIYIYHFNGKEIPFNYNYTLSVTT